MFNDKRHPREMAATEIERFLSSLAVERNVSAATQNQALAAILFLYREVLAIDAPWMEGIVRAKRPTRLPVVLNRLEVVALLAEMHGRERLMATLLYGSGLRLLEGLRLRIKEIDFEKREILVRAGKGDKDRVTMLPESARQPLVRHLEGVRRTQPFVRLRSNRSRTSGHGVPGSSPDRARAARSRNLCSPRGFRVGSAAIVGRQVPGMSRSDRWSVWPGG